MRAALLASITATALVAVACAQGPRTGPGEARLEAIHEAVKVRRRSPARAIALLEAAGPGAGLERFRLELLVGLLEARPAGSRAWRRAVAVGLPQALAARARLGLGRALIREGRTAAGAAALEEAAAEGSARADEVLLSVPGQAAAAGRRMAVRRPARLNGLDPRLERRILPALTPGEWLQRAASWRKSGQPLRAARELARRRWRGWLERARRLELARCWLDADRPRRALPLLPSPGRSDVAALLLRAGCERREAWDLFPRPAGRRHFALALRAAARVANFPRAAPADRIAALETVLEAATELGAIGPAWQAWTGLRRMGWMSRRRAWLGRRLGVAMARRGGFRARVRELERELPGQARCLRFWLAAGRRPDREALRKLAAAPVADLYAGWARNLLRLPHPAPARAAAPVAAGRPPATVALLLRWGETAAARREWRRLRRLRGAAPGEALAAAALEASGPRPAEAVRWLRAGFPDLGSVDMPKCPANAVQAYLPLRWADAVRRAARENGLDPWLVAALARQESTFAPRARSPRGAVGLLQLIPGTAARHAAALGLRRRPDLTDPALNLRLGARELAHLIDRFGALEPALAAYNGGEARVVRWWRRWPDARVFTEEIPVPETYTYVRRVVYLADAYRQVYADRWRQP